MTSLAIFIETAKVHTCWSQKCIHPKPWRQFKHSAEPQKTWNESIAAQSLSEDCPLQSSPRRFLSCQLPPCRSRRGLRRRQRSDFRIEAMWQPRGSHTASVSSVSASPFLSPRFATQISSPAPASTLMGQCEGVLTHKSHLKISAQYSEHRKIQQLVGSGGCAGSPGNQKVEQIAVTATASLSNSPPTDLRHVYWVSTLLLLKIEAKRWRGRSWC